MATVSEKIPVFDASAEVKEHWSELQEALHRVLRNGRYILGPEVAAFEREVAGYLNVGHAIGCNSGTDALVLALRALGIGPGDEVITTPFTFFATAEAVSNVGAVPVFVDIDPATYNIDPECIEAAISERSKAVMPVHLFGQAADMEPIELTCAKHGLKLIEDVAQAFGGLHRGRHLGSIGDAAAFSFFPSKNLGAVGDGGLVATNDPHVAEVAEQLRRHGAKRKYHNEMLGYNSRLDELQAAVLRVKLPHIDVCNDKRRRAARIYDQQLSGVSWLTTPHNTVHAHHVYHQYTVRITNGDRDDVAARLDEAGISTMVYYPRPVHRLPVYEGQAVELPHAERAARQVLSLPMGPFLEEESVFYVCEVIKNL